MLSGSMPTGLVTFLFADIESSSQLWERHGRGMQQALARHDDLLRTAVSAHNGQIVKTTGDGAYAVFDAVSDALLAAAAAQVALQTEPWPAIAPDLIRARIGIHTGEAELREGDYHGPTLNLAARLMSAGHGGQVLISAAAAEIARLPEGYRLRELGRYRLRGIGAAQRILQLCGPELRLDFPPLNAQNTAVRNLPAQTTQFVGRRRELAEIRRQILQGDTHLLTITGPGGMGKSRLAIEVARDIAGGTSATPFVDGVVFVSLTGVETVAAAVRAIGEALGHQAGGDDGAQARQLLAFLSEQRMLLILDNLEHLLAQGLSAFLDDLLTASAGVRILATSRELLNLRAETAFPLAGLEAPALAGEAAGLAALEASDAPQLFIQSAQRVAPSFALTAENAWAVVQICRLTAGIPLALELAAGWTGVLSPAEIAAELEKSFDLLSTTMGDVPERQRSLRAVFEGSWRLLSDREREAFLRLSVFRGGFQRQEGQAVAGVSLPVLLLLVNRSFLQRLPYGRFGLHEALRYFANEQLRQDIAAWEAARRAHSRAYAAFVSRQLPRLRSAEQQAGLQEIDRDLDNIRLAWERLAEQGDFTALVTQMLPGLYRFATMRMRHGDLELLLEAALRRLPAGDDAADSVPYAVLQTVIIDLAIQRLSFPPFQYPGGRELLGRLWPLVVSHRAEMGDWFDLFLQHHMMNVPGDEAERLWLDHVAALRRGADTWPLANSLQMLAEVLFWTDRDYERPPQYLEEALALFRDAGDVFAISQTLFHLGWMAVWQGAYQRAVAHLQNAQRLLAGQGEHLRRGRILRELQRTYLKLGQPQKGFPLLAEEQALYRQLDRLDLIRDSLHWESISAARFGDREHALRTRHETMDLARRIAVAYGDGREPDLGWDYFELGEIYRCAGDLAESQRYVELAAGLFEAAGDEQGIHYYGRALGDLALAAGQYDQAETHYRPFVAWARATQRLFELALSLTGLGRALRGQGRLAESERSLEEALRLADNPGIIELVLWPVMGLAELRAAQGEPLSAAALASFVLCRPLAWLEMRHAATALLETLRPSLPPDFDEADAAAEAARALIPALELRYFAA